MKTIDPIEAQQLVLKALDKDPAKQSGVWTIYQRIANSPVSVCNFKLLPLDVELICWVGFS